MKWVMTSGQVLIIFIVEQNEIVSTKYKEITDGEDMTNGLKDWLWRVEVFSKKEEEDE
jgi:hypothetical protein